MNREEIQDLLDQTYELEGLLHLALAREEDMPEALPRLIRSKIATLAAESTEGTEAADSTDGYELSENYEHYDSERIEGAEDGFNGLDLTKEEPSDNDISEHSENSEVSERSKKSEHSELSDYSHSADIKIKPENSASPVAFSLNDRFLFTRELFGGSRAEFDNALNRLAGMESFEEAEEYFYDDCGFNPKDETVADFMRIVASYLK